MTAKTKMEKKGVVWVSTVLYILISLAILSLVLVSVQPVIDKNKDRTVIFQTIDMLKEIDSTIEQVSVSQDTNLGLKLKISRGNLMIDSQDNLISWELRDSAYQYSEENRTVNVTSDARMTAFSKKIGNKWATKIFLNYTNRYDLTYAGKEETKVLSESEYDLFIKNVNTSTSPIEIDFTAG
ncbi:MAG: hypothetical protein NTX24_02020 [Candidatus Pacearchaeota archaeon]|nr:hypothetical protein [Candidatus Pacearchaeota archaeon]